MVNEYPMSIAIIIPDSWEPLKLVRWSTSIARAKDEDLLIIRTRRMDCPQNSKKRNRAAQLPNSPLGNALELHADDFEIIELDKRRAEIPGREKRNKGDKSERRIYVTRLSYSDLVDGVLREVKTLRIRLLIVPRPHGIRLGEEGFAIECRLFREVPCETLLLRPGATMADDFTSILVATSGSKQSGPAISFGAAVAASEESKITALYVDERGQSTSASAGPNQVDRSIRKSLKKQADHVQQDTIVDQDVPRGVQSYVREKGHDVVVVGAGEHLSEDSRIQDSVPETLMSEMDEPTVVVVRNALTLSNRMLKSFDQRTKSLFPQLDRDGRIELVERLESCSKWDFDFMFLICLATLIASLGLSVDSTPVVIGAMLVAPLMSPMLGLGLSVVQGNRKMGHRCTLTIGRGIFVALMTACCIGAIRILFASDLTTEMTNRGAPGVPDLVVAFASGAVAAYAFGRPHLLSVIPGIAIATSLIPPLATVGLGFVALEFDVAIGAALLFTSNFVAIVLGTAVSLWVVGMRGPRSISPFSAWTRRWIFGFCATCFFLTLFFTVQRQLRSQAEVPSVAKKTPNVARQLAVDTGRDPALPGGKEPETELETELDDAVVHQGPERKDLSQPERLPVPQDESPSVKIAPDATASHTAATRPRRSNQRQSRVVFKPPPAVDDADRDGFKTTVPDEERDGQQRTEADNKTNDENRHAGKRRPVLKFLRYAIAPPVSRPKM